MNCESGDPAYRRLKDQLTASTGLSFEGERDRFLAESIGRRISDLGLRDCAGYAEFLADGAQPGVEVEALIERLTVGETYFFRDPEQFAAIRDIIIPDILERKRSSRSLRIWSAGCSSGAEPYSMAILLMHEMGGRLAGWQIAIDATDLNRSSLAQAAEGKFRAWALRGTSDAVKRDCFSNEGRIWTIHPRYRQWISFHPVNLAGGEFAAEVQNGNTPFDLILCRNVMIYFAPEAVTQLIGRLHRSLGDGGWLVVGASEYSGDNYNAFRTVNAPGARLYQRMAPVPTPIATLAAPLARPLPTPPDVVDFASLEGKKLLAEYRLNPAIHYDQAVIFENLGLAGESERSLRRAIYLDRNFALAHYRLGLLLKKDGQDSSAARSFGNVLMALAGALDDEIVAAGGGLTVTGLKELATMHLENKSGS